MWFLEWEENSEDHKKKQKKCLILAIACWAAALVVLFVTEKILYGEILKTNASGFLGATVGTAIIFFLQRDSLQIKVQKDRNKRMELILIAVVTAVIGALTAVIGQELFLIQWFCLIPAILWFAKLEEQDRFDKNMVHSFALIVVSLIVIVTTVFVPRLQGYRNVYAAERIVTAEGYEDAEYLGWLKGAWVYQDAKDKTFYEKGMKDELFYMVYGEKEGEAYRFIIDPRGGEIILAASEKEEPELGNWYK